MVIRVKCLEEEYLIPIGKANITREGSDVTMVSFNKMMKVAMGAAEELAKEGIDAEVIDLRTIRPLDWDTIIESVKKTNRLSYSRRAVAIWQRIFRNCIPCTKKTHSII